jgi:hypothetical protein
MDIIKWGTLRYLSFDIYMFNLLCKRDAVLSASAERESIRTSGIPLEECERHPWAARAFGVRRETPEEQVRAKKVAKRRKEQEETQRLRAELQLRIETTERDLNERFNTPLKKTYVRAVGSLVVSRCLPGTEFSLNGDTQQRVDMAIQEFGLACDNSSVLTCLDIMEQLEGARIITAEQQQQFFEELTQITARTITEEWEAEGEYARQLGQLEAIERKHGKEPEPQSPEAERRRVAVKQAELERVAGSMRRTFRLLAESRHSRMAANGLIEIYEQATRRVRMQVRHYDGRAYTCAAYGVDLAETLDEFERETEQVRNQLSAIHQRAMEMPDAREVCAIFRVADKLGEGGAGVLAEMREPLKRSMQGDAAAGEEVIRISRIVQAMKPQLRPKGSPK